MLDVWSWICDLPNSKQWSESNSPLSLELASTSVPSSSQGKSTASIQLKAERTTASDTETALNFTVCLQGFSSLNTPKTLWVSDTCPLPSDKPFLPLVLHLLQEIISRSPMSHDITCPRSRLQKLKPDPVSWIMETHSPESFSSFFNLVFLTHLFWLCVFDAPSEVGSLYFNSLLGPNLEGLTCLHAPVMRTFLISIGVDAELCFMRTCGYMLAKWSILREVGVGLQALTHARVQHLGFSYATEAHGLWALKGYAPVSGMKLTRSNGQRSKFPVMEAEESVLRYALAHQQLEAVIQLEYSVGFHDGYILVNARVDNLRFHVARLGFNKNDDADYQEEKHFPSRIRVWVGPEVGSTYVAGLSLGRSTGNGEREVETQRIVKSNVGKSKATKVKARARVSTKTKMKDWRWEQDAEGNAAVFDAVLCNNVMGQEIAAGLAASAGGGGKFQKRCGGAGGVVFAGDEYGEAVGWRLSREMEGSVLKWRIGGRVWLSYWPNSVKSSYSETRCVEWCDEVDLPLIPGK
ncbi:hypothetical protein SLA2020_483360 [Shorea laevis]